MPPELDVPDAELRVLQALWQLGRATIRQLADLLYPGGQAAQYGTVQKLLERLEARECVRRDRTPWPHVFEAAVDRETLIGHRLRQTAEKLCGGSLTPLLTHLLNEYLERMTTIALAHGGTVDKFIGDAVMVFFGDPETKGVSEDALACLRMAFEMQARTTELNARWRGMGVEERFHVRMGINTGFCNVGNFGSDDRMDYTIIGAEANLAARLQSIAEPGGIVMSYETYALVGDMVRARPLPAISVKGISREIVPYAFEGLVDEMKQRPNVISEHAIGVDLFLDLEVMDKSAVERTKRLLQQALAAVELKAKPGGA